MMRHCLLFLPLLTLWVSVSAQSKFSREEKYQHYRERLRHEMMRCSGDGMTKGTYLPMECKYNAKGKVVGYWADATWWQGHYVAMLATEYYRLQRAQQPTEATLQELRAALKVYDRLDLLAEPCWGGNRDTTCNGFYLRDDITLAETEGLKIDLVQSDYLDHCGDRSTRGNAPSQDQAWATYIGLALTQKLVDDTALYQHCAAIAERLVRAMQYTDEKGKPHWQIMNPVTGNLIQKEGDIQWLQYAHATIGTMLSGKDLHFGRSGKRHWRNIWEIIQDNVLIDKNGHFTWYGVLSLSAVMNDGGGKCCYDWLVKKCNKIAKRRPDLQQSFIFPHLPLVNVVLYGSDGLSLLPAEEYIQLYLDTAPDRGAGTQMVEGEMLRTDAPWHSLSLFCPWHTNHIGDFNMLDYMLLYNLVEIVYH